MATQQMQPPPPTRVIELGQAMPGIQRDGTPFYSKRWTDGVWVRFQRGKPKKMGGYRAMITNATGPIRKILIDARQGAYTAHMFSPWGIERIQFDPSTGAGGGISIRTPSGFTAPNQNYNWSADKLVSTGGGTTNLLALASVDLSDISNDTAGILYAGDITATSALTPVTSASVNITASGDVCVLPPFVFITGSSGLIQNSNPNNISDATGWVNSTGANVYANIAYVAGTKVIKGLPLRGGSNSPAGMFWALDALIRVSFQGASTGYFNFWRYDTITNKMSILSKNSVIEYDGIFYWVGVDRFFMYNGVVQELPNDTNLNYFFDNLNTSQRQKVFAVKVPRYGEIWWFFPKGQGQTECNAAVIYNVRENTWYDALLMRTCGQEADIFPQPIMCGSPNPTVTIRVPYTVVTGTFAIGQTVTGGTSGATGIIARISGEPALDLTNVTGTFQNAEAIHNVGSTATGTTGAGTFPAQSLNIDTIWEHEVGTDQVILQQQTPVLSSITTPYMSYVGGLGQQSPEGFDLQTRMTRIEPDFTSLGALGRATGNMTVTVNGQSYPNASAAYPVENSASFPFTDATPYIYPRFMAREMTVTFTSNDFNGFYEMGRILVELEQGDGRG